MNQGIAFSRTLRALDADDFRASKLGLLIAAALLVAWTWWMLAARVPQYESTNYTCDRVEPRVRIFPIDHSDSRRSIGNCDNQRQGLPRPGPIGCLRPC